MDLRDVEGKRAFNRREKAKGRLEENGRTITALRRRSNLQKLAVASRKFSTPSTSFYCLFSTIKESSSEERLSSVRTRLLSPSELSSSNFDNCNYDNR